MPHPGTRNFINFLMRSNATVTLAAGRGWPDIEWILLICCFRQDINGVIPID